jgi:ribosomal protein S18 acetylase RimI-like enzyme
MSLAFPSAEALGVRFRPARDADLPFLAHLYASTRWQEVAQTGWPDEVQARFLAQQFELQHRHYSEHYPGMERLVIERHGVTIGRIYVDETPGMLHLIDIALLPEFRGAGIGSAILADLLSQALHGKRKVGLYVEKDNRVYSLYDRLGFAKSRDEGVYDYLEWAPAGDRCVAGM